MARILVVDDEPVIADGVAAYLRRDGHRVDTAATAEAAVAHGRDGVDLVILDLMLADGSGFDVLRTLRGEGIRVPVIILSARVDVIDRVAGLELGADDYVTKPFEPRELVARVGAVMRRSGTDRWPASVAPPPPAPAGPAAPAASAAAAGDQHATAPRTVLDLEVDEAAREVRRGADPLRLTRTEFDLLATLARCPGRVLSRSQLATDLFGGLYEESDRTIDSHVRNLRQKLGPGPDGTGYVETIRGVGYRLVRAPKERSVA